MCSLPTCHGEGVRRCHHYALLVVLVAARGSGGWLLWRWWHRVVVVVARSGGGGGGGTGVSGTGGECNYEGTPQLLIHCAGGEVASDIG
jgi:hypothetical protein